MVDFVEICNVCSRKAIIKAAKRIFNSVKIYCSYCDFYFGVTFLEHTVFALLIYFIIILYCARYDRPKILQIQQVFEIKYKNTHMKMYFKYRIHFNI